MGQRTRRIARAMAASAITTLVAAGLSGCGGGTGAQQQETTAAAPADPRAEAAQNVRLVGYNDLQGRTALVVTTKSDAANGSWVYVGHHESYHDGKPLLNPITGKMEWNGTSILDIADPANPKLVWHIPNDTNKNSRGVSVVYDYKFDGSGRDYLIRNSETLTEGETGTDLKYQIFDITTRDSDPSKISLVAEITGTPPNSCGQGCGGKFIMRAHKGWWSQETGYYYAASGEPGFRNVIVQIFDLKNPKEPKLVGRAWIPGLKNGEPGYEGQYSHHPVVDEQNKRLYVGYRNAGGQAAGFDISNPAQPKLLWNVDMNPPHRGPHTVSPIVYDTVPNFGKSALPRTYAFIVDEAGGAGDMKPCPNGVRPDRTWWTSRPRRSHSRCRYGRCRSATSARRAGASGRTRTPIRSTARSTGSRTRSRGSRTSTPASASSISAIRTTCGRSATTFRRRTRSPTPSPPTSRS